MRFNVKQSADKQNKILMINKYNKNSNQNKKNTSQTYVPINKLTTIINKLSSKILPVSTFT